MKYAHLKGNSHLTDFEDCKDSVIENTVKLHLKLNLKRKEDTPDTHLFKYSK